MDFIQCSIYIKIETEDPTAELLNYISANLNEINDYFVLNFIPIFNKNLKDDSFISKLQDEGVTGLPCMVTYINDKKLDIKEGNRDIINYLMQNFSDKISKLYFDLIDDLRANSVKAKEILINAGVTLVVVMVALAVHDKFVAPKLK